MSSIVISGDTSGAITLAAPSVAGTNTVTIPANSGVVMVSGNMPAFEYLADGTQSVGTGVYTKILFATKNFDTASAVTSSKFQPTIAGYYQINAAIGVGIVGEAVIAIYKNGSVFRILNDVNATLVYSITGTILMYLNGSTDYVEIYWYQGSGSNKSPSAANSFFSGCLVRTA